MDIAGMIGEAVAFMKANPLIALAVGAVILFAFYRRPGMSFFVLGVIVLLVFIYYVIMSMSSGAVSEKERLIEKSTAPREVWQIDVSRMLR